MKALHQLKLVHINWNCIEGVKRDKDIFQSASTRDAIVDTL